MKLIVCGLLLAALAMTGCNLGNSQLTDPVSPLSFTAVIVHHKLDAMRDYLQEGELSYSSSRLRILTPVRYVDRELNVYYDMQGSSEGLQVVGRTIEFSADPSVFAEGRTIFVGALKNISIIGSRDP